MSATSGGRAAGTSVLFVTSRLRTGGGLTLLQHRVAHLRDEPVRMSIVALHPTHAGDPAAVEALRAFEAADVPVHVLEHRSTKDLPRTVVQVARLARAVDVVHQVAGPDSIPAAASRLARRPLIRDIITSNPEDLPRGFRRGGRTATVNLAISHAAAASAGAPRTRVIYPHLATAEQRGEAVPPVPEAGDPTVLVVSRLSARKGIERLPDVISATAQRLPGVRFLIAGDGELRRSLEEEIVRRALSPHVAVLGARDDVPGLHSLADIYLSPSAAEGLVGYATIEAATYGTPIVATSIPAVTEVLEDGSDALLVDPADGLGMADAIVRLARDPELAARLASGAARAIDEAIDVRRSTEELVALYDTFGPAG